MSETPTFRIDKGTLNLASPRLGTKIVAVSDDFFAAASRMLADSEPVFIEDKYDDNGKWMDGWESRRRRSGGHDWCLISLGLGGVIRGVDIDTAHFTGNFPPEAMLEACFSETQPDDETAWETIVEKTSLWSNSHHYQEVESRQTYNWVRLHIYPDGGIARLRLFGRAACTLDLDGKDVVHELSNVACGGRIVGFNDAHYGNAWSVLLDGRGQDMGDGWETRRRREPGNDFIVFELGARGAIEALEIDTAFYKGNFPDRFSVSGADLSDGDAGDILEVSAKWPQLIGETKLSADAVHNFDDSMLQSLGPLTHLRLDIYPDGGVSRFRAFGKIA